MIQVDETTGRVRYPGGKNRAELWRLLLALSPTHTCFAEPFAGSAAFTRHKTPALLTVLCDLDPRVGEFLKRQKMARGLPAHYFQRCGLAWLAANRDELGPEWLVYCDPPYLPETRSKRRVYVDGATSYEFTRRDHERLLGILAGLSCHVMLSGYRSALYDSALATWQRHDQRTQTRGGPRIESVWTNFDAHTVARAEPRLVPGRSWRERERIGRKGARWERMFAEMAPHERAYLLATLLAATRKASPSEAGVNARQPRYRVAVDGRLFDTWNEAREWALAQTVETPKLKQKRAKRA